MKHLLPILLLLAFASCQKEEINPNQIQEFSIHSDSAHATYTIKVALPEHYSPSTQKYATLYVLDGDQNFNFVTAKCNAISSEFSTDNVLVVSIGYGNDRSVDYTPTKAQEGGGGAEKFMQFLEHELIPRVEKDFSAEPSRESRIILGHSFGGLLAAYAFTNFNRVFGNYLMLSPSLWYDNEIMLRLEQENREINKENHHLVYMGLGELESGGRMLVPYVAFHQRLEKYYPGIELISRLQPRLDHGGSKNPNIEEGLKFYFQNR